MPTARSCSYSCRLGLGDASSYTEVTYLSLGADETDDHDRLCSWWEIARFRYHLRNLHGFEFPHPQSLRLINRNALTCLRCLHKPPSHCFSTKYEERWLSVFIHLPLLTPTSKGNHEIFSEITRTTCHRSLASSSSD
jgi:hypothetical protein